MNNRYYIIAALISTITLMTSCLSDPEEITRYDDAAITSFSLGTLKRTIHTTARDGVTDSTFQVSVNCNSYKFAIDQNNGLIYNTDSLPVGTRVDKSLVNISTMNSGFPYLKNIDSDSLRFISSTDSLDFSKERTIRVFANNGEWSRDYKVNIYVHNEVADTLYWERKNDNANIAALENMRALYFNSKIYAYGTTAGAAKMFATADGNTWNEVALPATASVTACANAVYMYLLTAEGDIYITDNGSNMTKMATATDNKHLLVASSSQVFALNNTNMITVSSDHGATWVEDAIDSDKSKLPTRDFNGYKTTIATNADIEKLVIIGNQGLETDSAVVSWTKVIDTRRPEKTQPWMYQNDYKYSENYAPSMEHLSVTQYGNMAVLVGGKGIGKSTEKAFSNLWYSLDYGSHWFTGKSLTFPGVFSSSETSFTIIADNAKNFWLLCGGSGQVWRAHHTSVSWSK